MGITIIYLIADKIAADKRAKEYDQLGFTIPSWLMEEFLTPECRCASYSAMSKFCESHDCNSKMFDTDGQTLTPIEVTNNEVQLAFWIVQNKACLTEACYTTQNTDVCGTIGVQPSGKDVPRPHLPSTSSDNYCSGVNWEPYVNQQQNSTKITTPVVKSILQDHQVPINKILLLGVGESDQEKYLR